MTKMMKKMKESSEEVKILPFEDIAICLCIQDELQVGLIVYEESEREGRKRNIEKYSEFTRGSTLYRAMAERERKKNKNLSHLMVRIGVKSTYGR